MSNTNSKKTTQELDKLLEGASWGDVANIVKANRQSMEDNTKEFYYYMKDTIESKNFKMNEVYRAAGFSDHYGSDIISMHRHTPDRDRILRLCIAGHFSITETNKALKLYGMTPLYTKNRRDSIIFCAIHNMVFKIDEIDEKLAEAGLAPLMLIKDLD